MRQSWFPNIVSGLTLLLIVAVAFVVKQQEGRVPDNEVSSPNAVIAPTVEAYDSALAGVLAGYQDHADAKRVYEALILMTVPAERREMHLDLVITFARLAENADDGQTRLDLLKAKYPDLSL